MNRPGKIPIKQVADDLTSDGIVPLAGAEDCHRFGVEQGIQVMLGHGDLLEPSLGMGFRSKNTIQSGLRICYKSTRSHQECVFN